LLAGKSIPLHMKDDLNVLLALYGSASSENLPAWAILRDLYPYSSHIMAVRELDLKIPLPLSKKPTLPKVEFFDIKHGHEFHDIRFVVENGALVKRYQSNYQYLSKFISEDLASLEEEFPGCAEHFIRQYKAYLEAAKPISDSTELTIRHEVREGLPNWKNDFGRKLADAFNDGKEGDFVATIAQVKSKDLVYELSQLDAKDLSVNLELASKQEDLLLA
jgi:hypothetical protein